jgi:hypothetical protein
VKAIYVNHRLAKLLKERVHAAAAAGKDKGGREDGARHPLMLNGKLMTRSEFQLLQRNRHDIGKLPLFALLVVFCGEWLALIVPFIPGAVPLTCRIPKQIDGMRKKSEERRRASFRAGISAPTKEEEEKSVAAAAAAVVGHRREGQTAMALDTEENILASLAKLRADQLFHLSCTLSLHSRMWDRVQTAPPSRVLRKRIAKRLTYLAADDWLLSRHGNGDAAEVLDAAELQIACEQRGLDVLGKQEEVLRSTLHEWLERRKRGEGGGGGTSGILNMLFRRPNAWDLEKER